MARQLYFAMSSTGKRQSAKLAPMPLAAIDERVNITSPTFVGTEKTVEEILDCIGEEVVSREVTRKIHRVTIEMPFVPAVAARFFAYAKGVAAAPTGATANKQFTITLAGGTSGTFFLHLGAYDGYPAEDTAPIPYNPTAAQIKYAYESLDNIGYGNTIVTDGGGGVFTVELVGKRASANVPTPTSDVTGLNVGATVVVAQTVAGSQKSHAITENPGYENYYTGFVMGFEDEPGSELHLADSQVEAVRVTAPEGGGIMTMSVDIITRDLRAAAGYVVPPCVVPRPMRLADCRLTHGGVDLADKLLEFAYSYVNNIVTGNPAYTGRGVKPTRLIRAKRRTRTLTFRLLEGLTSAMRQAALIAEESGITAATVLRMGTPGENVTETIPNNLLTVDARSAGGVDRQADTDETITRYVSNFDKVGVTAPSSSVAMVAQATAFLLSA